MDIFDGYLIISLMGFKINNRRYTGSKQKLVKWIRTYILKYSKNKTSFCDLFAGTGVVTNALIDNFKEFHINDFLYSNHCIYQAFFSKAKYNDSKLIKYKREYNKISPKICNQNFVSKNYGNKFFSKNDSLLIGEIRERIEFLKIKKLINTREYNILLTSLIYSFDRCANTVGHYEAYIRKPIRKDSFKFELIDPIINENSKAAFHIYREDANELAKKISCDVVYIDPPYSSRQYSRFYHLIESIVKWDKPKLYGTALKPVPENMSFYCSAKAIDVFRELIADLNCKYIFVSYNNTYNSRSKSSKNKMKLNDILKILSNKGKTKIISKKYNAFNAGKTNITDHKEYLIITKVAK